MEISKGKCVVRKDLQEAGYNVPFVDNYEDLKFVPADNTSYSYFYDNDRLYIKFGATWRAVFNVDFDFIETAHKLNIVSLSDAQAVCQCGWSLSSTGERTEEEIQELYQLHL